MPTAQAMSPAAAPDAAPEPPIYILHQQKKRALVPKIISFLALGTLFYAGILLNIYLLQLSRETESIVRFSSLIFLIFIIAPGSILSLGKAAPYRFYRDRIEHQKKKIYYPQIVHTTPQQDFLDKLFRTYSISLNENFVLRNIPEHIQLSNYLQQLISYNGRHK